MAQIAGSFLYLLLLRKTEILFLIFYPQSTFVEAHKSVIRKLAFVLFLLGADACETAARIFKCGVDKDPAGMTNLIETSSANAAKEVTLKIFAFESC